MRNLHHAVDFGEDYLEPLVQLTADVEVGR
jgi:hypothetical protein